MMFQRIEEIKQYINVSKQLDIQILKPYVDTALKERVLPFIGTAIMGKLEDEAFELPTKEAIYEEIKMAVANYAVALSIPFLKIHFSNTGANAYNDNKMERSPWWDIRDFGLNAVSIGDQALNGAIMLIEKTSLKVQLPFVREVQGAFFSSPREFSEIYPIGDSYEVYLKLLPLMRDVWETMLLEEFSPCVLEDIKADDTAFALLKKAIAYYTIADATYMQMYTFTKLGIVLMWEQLPWQKSMVIDGKHLDKIRELSVEKANRYKLLLIKYIKEHPTQFACYQGVSPVTREPVLKKSGIYF